MTRPAWIGCVALEPPEVTGVVGDHDEVPFGGVARNVPVLPSGLADMCHVLGFLAGLTGNRNQIDAQTLIDQKFHPAAIDASFRRVLSAGG